MILVAFIFTSFHLLLAFQDYDDLDYLINGPYTVKENRQEDDTGSLLKRMNDELLILNRASSILEWQGQTCPSPQVSSLNVKMSRLKTTWRNTWCSKISSRLQGSRDIEISEKRMIQLLCRGPKYTPHQARALTIVFEKLSSSYATTEVCRIENNNFQKCYHGEPDLERLLSTSRNESELRWAWTSWRNEMSKVKGLFVTSVNLQNIGARNNGYHDIGQCWREELESLDLEHLVDDLYREIEPLYELLHAVVRFRLAQKYPDIVDPEGPIPAHLLGNMWAQNWESLINLIWPDGNESAGNVTEALMRKNLTVLDMVERAEDFYVSMGLPRMTKTFWEKSVFEKKNISEFSSCHGTAANMYQEGDYRILVCAEVNAEDFYVVHHELGHIQYYMAYKDQPAIFMDGANSAFHEAVGDAVMYGVTTPQHLQRLGLISDSTPKDAPEVTQPAVRLAIACLATQGFYYLIFDSRATGSPMKRIAHYLRPSDKPVALLLDNHLPFLLKQALSKIPQLPHGLVVDKWRWNVFSGEIEPAIYNSAWWAITRRYQGIEPPAERSDTFFDPAAKFHVTDNTPYIRYFLGYILQVQIFKGMCEAAVTGRVGDPKFKIPLHRCDIYGSKNAGKKLKQMMALGSSVNWKYALNIATGDKNYRVEPLLEYYEPIYKWLKLQVKYYNIPVGWDKKIKEKG